MDRAMIETEGLRREFAGVSALAGVSITVPRGTVTCLLGHNGAGKSTMVKVLTTLLAPTSGQARVAGHDVVVDAGAVRSRIGVASQFASVDESLNGTENLVLVARLLGARRPEARARAAELVRHFDLDDAATRPVGTYSGGMRRRLDLAASLVGRPDVVFLDEPTTGLDPASRNALWELIRELVSAGTTVLLTTQYLPEAEALADQVVVLASGAVVRTGTVPEIKACVGRRSIRLATDPRQLPRLRAAMHRAGLVPGEFDDRTLGAPLASAADIAHVIREVDRDGIDIADLSFTEPTLDDAYLALTAEHSPAPQIAV